MDAQVVRSPGITTQINLGTDASNHASLVLRLRNLRNDKVGSLHLNRVPETEVGTVLDILYPHGDSPSAPSVEALRSAIRHARNQGAGLTHRERFLSDLLKKYAHGIDPSKPQRPRMRSIAFSNERITEAPRSRAGVESFISGEKNLLWIDIEGPAATLPPMLKMIRQTLCTSDSTVEACLKKDRPVTASRKDRYLFVTLKDMLRQRADPLAVKPVHIHAVISDGLLVTIRSRPSRAVNQVIRELKKSEGIRSEELVSSNYLFARILGGVLHGYWERLRPFEQEASRISKLYRVFPSAELLDHVDMISRQLRLIADSLVGFRQVVASLRESRSLFRATRSKETLERYESLIRDTVNKCQSLEKNIEDKKDSWQIYSQERTTRRLNKLTILAGAIAVPSAAFGFFGQNFYGPLFGNSQIIAGNLLAVGSSLFLLGMLGVESLRHRSRRGSGFRSTRNGKTARHP